MTHTHGRAWIGAWLIGVALLHTAAAALLFGDVLLDLLRRGLFNTVGHAPLPNAAVWFLLFGPGIGLFGMAIRALERAGQLAEAPALGIGLLLLTLLGVLLMPASGFWLAFPPALALLRTRAAPDRHGTTSGAA